MEIPEWIRSIYYKVDKDRKNGITQQEIDSLNRAKEGIGSIYVFEAGMDLNSFVQKNRSVFEEYINYDGNPIVGRQVLENGKLEQTEKTRNKSKDSKQSVEVGQGEYVIASLKDTKYLQTFGLGPCVGVTLYDKQNKKGFMAHIDTSDKAKALRDVLNQLSFKGFNIETTEARIIGGESSFSLSNVKLIKSIIEDKNIPIEEMDVLGHTVRAIQLNLKTGEVTDYDETVINRETPQGVIRQTLF